MDERAQGGDRWEAMAQVGTGKYLENVGCCYASAVSALALRGGRGQRREVPEAGEGRQGPGTQPGGRGAAHSSGGYDRNSDTGMK